MRFEKYTPVEPSVVVSEESRVTSSPENENGPACAIAQVLCSNVNVFTLAVVCPFEAKKQADWFDAPALFDRFELSPWKRLSWIETESIPADISPPSEPAVAN